MGSILNAADRAAIQKRLGTVTASSTARWGRMDVHTMFTHLRLSALLALGELPVACKSPRVVQLFPLKHLILHAVPFPKNAPTAPELVPASAGTVDTIRPELCALMERMAVGPREGDGPVHPLLGRLTFREWGVSTYKHSDHHLRQFGA